MRISDWSSDVCSSDLIEHVLLGFRRLWKLVEIHWINNDMAGGTGHRALARPLQRLPVRLRQIKEPRACRRIHLKHFLSIGRNEANPRHGRLMQPLSVVAQSRSEEHTSELKSLMRLSYAVF